MISHALNIVTNEINRHFVDVFQMSPAPVVMGNLAEGFSTGNGGGNSDSLRDKLVLSVVNVKEEKALKNLPNYVRDDSRLKVSYENQPVFLNLHLLLSATHSKYHLALLVLSRAISFFQYKNVFTQDNVSPASLTPDPSLTAMDQLATFKIILDLYSPSMEEVNHLWGTLGGKQYPFAMYMMRMVDLKFRAVQGEAPLVSEVAFDFFVKPPLAN